MRIDDMSLLAIDNMRHVVVSEEIVRAAGFAYRYLSPARPRGEADRTVVRFVTALVMTDRLTTVSDWARVLDSVRALENEKEKVRR